MIPHLQILNPSEARTAKKSAQIALEFDRPTLVRLDKGVFHQPFNDKKIENGLVVHITGNQNLIIYTGTIGKVVIHAHELLQANGDSWGVIELFQISPLPKSLLEILSHVKRIVVIEENSEVGGLFSILAEVIVLREESILVSQISLPNEQTFSYGERDWLSQNLGLNTLEKVGPSHLGSK